MQISLGKLDKNTLDKLRAMAADPALEGVTRLSVAPSRTRLYVMSAISLLVVWAMATNLQDYALILVLGLFGLWLGANAGRLYVRFTQTAFPRDLVFFDQAQFLRVQDGVLDAQLLNEFEKVEARAEGQAQFDCTFSFKERNLGFVYQGSQQTLNQFTGGLRMTHAAGGASIAGQSSDPDILASMPEDLRRSARGRRPRWPVWVGALIVGIGIFIAGPMMVDRNAFNDAAENGTAAAYRAYLSDDRHSRYRDQAIDKIRAHYDQEIAHYERNQARTPAQDAFLTMVRYLRDQDIFELPVSFTSTSQLADHAVPDAARLAPVTPHFTAELNKAREAEAVEAIDQALGRIFPTGALGAELAEQLDAADPGAMDPGAEARVTVDYVYRNLADAMYYSTEEEHLPESSRTLYYGIAIDWTIALYMPEADEPLHRFQLRSEPAPTFSIGATGGEQSVYESMASSAFNDLAAAFARFGG